VAGRIGRLLLGGGCFSRVGRAPADPAEGRHGRDAGGHRRKLEAELGSNEGDLGGRARRGVARQDGVRIEGHADLAARLVVVALAEHVGADRGRFARDAAGGGDDLAQFAVVPGLADEAEHLALVDRAEHRLEVGEAGQQDAHRARCQLADLAQAVDAGQARHALVADHHVDVLLGGDARRLGGIVGDEHLEVAEQRAQCARDARLVVDEQHA